MTTYNLATTNLSAGQTVALESSSLPGGVLMLTALANPTVPQTRYLPLTDVHTDAGLPIITATAATTLPGIARTAGSSLYLTGVATSGAQGVTTKMLWEFNLPSTYVAGANIPVIVNCVVPTAANVTAASTTMTVAAYTETNGVEAAISVTAAQQIALTTATNLTFTITGTALTPGQHVALELVMLVTTITGGASSGQVNSVAYQA